MVRNDVFFLATRRDNIERREVGRKEGAGGDLLDNVFLFHVEVQVVLCRLN